MTSTILRWGKARQRARELAAHAPRRAELENLIASGLGLPHVRLVPAPSKGGYDEIYFAESPSKRFGVLRANSAHKVNTDPVSASDPGLPLAARARIDAEWNSYSLLHPLGLAPEPLWRAEDASLCAWVEGQRLSRCLARRRDLVWDLLERVFESVKVMHGAGVVHQDLNLGNVLLTAPDQNVVFLDFEFGPSDWMTRGQQETFDYLRLVDNALKPRRGGRLLASDPSRLVRLLDDAVSDEAKGCDTRPLVEWLPRLRDAAELRRAMSSVFTQLEDEGAL